MKQENISQLEQILRAAAPRVQVDSAMSTRLEQSMRSTLTPPHKKFTGWRRRAAVAAAIVLLAGGGIALYSPQPPHAPCYVGRINAAAAEPILPPYAVQGGMSYGIAAGEYEIVIIDVPL